MSSQIDPTKPVDGTPAVKSELRANLASARTELGHGGFALGLTPARYQAADERVTSHLAGIDAALGYAPLIFVAPGSSDVIDDQLAAAGGTIGTARRYQNPATNVTLPAGIGLAECVLIPEVPPVTLQPAAGVTINGLASPVALHGMAVLLKPAGSDSYRLDGLSDQPFAFQGVVVGNLLDQQEIAGDVVLDAATAPSGAERIHTGTATPATWTVPARPGGHHLSGHNLGTVDVTFVPGAGLSQIKGATVCPPDGSFALSWVGDLAIIRVAA